MLRDALPHIKTALPGPRSMELIARRQKAIPNGVACAAPCVISRGEGAVFEDLDGNIFLDWAGGLGVLNIGYSHPEVIEAIRMQSGRYLHTSINIVHYPEYIRLAEKMGEIVPVRGDDRKTILINSGAEAVENAVKFAKKFTGRPDIIVFTGAFHGRTNLAMSMTAKIRPIKYKMGPFPPGIHRCEYPYMYRRPAGLAESEGVGYYVEKLEAMFREYVAPDEVAAIVIEPVQGEGGVIAAPIEYIKELRRICDEHGVLLIADEVQTGFCRTGRLFASEYWAQVQAAPDLVASAKSIAGGIPLSAVTGRAEIMDSPAAGEVGGTYAGNPLACAAALKVIEVMERDNYAAKALAIEQQCVPVFESWKDKYELVGDVRHHGAMMAIEFVRDRKTKEPAKEEVSALISECARNGLLTTSAGLYANALRFLMPLCIQPHQVGAGLEILESAIYKLMKNNMPSTQL